MSVTVPKQVIVENGVPKPLGEVLTEQSTALATAISTTSIGAKGDLLAGTAPGTVTNLPVGTDNQMLVADSTKATGLSWKDSTVVATSFTSQGITSNGTSIFNGTQAVGDVTPTVIVNSPPTVNTEAQRVLSVRLNGIESFWVNGIGALYLNAGIVLPSTAGIALNGSGSAVLSGTAGGSILSSGELQASAFAARSNAAGILRGNVTDGASAVALEFGNSAVLATLGAKIASFYSDQFTSEKAFIDAAGRGSFSGGLSPGTDAGVAQPGRLFQGIGVPSNANGADGDYYFRTDTAGTVNQRIYVRVAGTWTALDPSNVMAPAAFSFTSGVPDSTTAVAFALNNSLTLATAGAKLLSVRNAGVEKAYIDYLGAGYFSGQVSAGGGAGTVAAGLLAPTSGSAAMRGNVLDGATAIANRFRNSAALVTAGAKIASFYSDDGVTERAYIGLDGRLFSDSHLSYGANAVTVKGQSPDGATAVGVILDNFPGLVTAGGKILSIRNAGVEKAFIDKDGSLWAASTITSGGSIVSGSGFVTAASPAVLQLRGNIADGATVIANKIGNVNALATAGAKIASFYNDNFVTEKAFIDKDGKATFNGGIVLPQGQGIALNGAGSAVLSGTSVGDVVATGEIRGINVGTTGIFYQSGTNTPATLRGNANDSATAVATILNSNVNLVTAGAKLLSVRNANAEKAYVDLNGNVFSGGTVSATGTSSLTMKGQNADSATAVGVITDTAANYTAGTGARLMSVRNNGVEKLWIDPSGTITASGNIAAAGTYLPGGTNPILIKGTVADGATAIANKIGSNTALATAGAKIASFYSDNFVTEKAFVDKDGKGSFTGGVSPGTPAAVAQTGRIFQGSGAPANVNGADGDFYFRTDTPGTAGQRLYARSAGVWTAVDVAAAGTPAPAVPSLFTTTPRISAQWNWYDQSSTNFGGIGAAAPTRYGAGSVTQNPVGWAQFTLPSTANTTSGYTGQLNPWTTFAKLPKASTRVRPQQLTNSTIIFEISDTSRASGGGAPNGVAPSTTGAPFYIPTLGGTNSDWAQFGGIHYDSRVGANWIIGSGNQTNASWIDSGVAVTTTDDWLLIIDLQSATSIVFTITNCTTASTYTTTKTTNMPQAAFQCAPYIGAVNWAAAANTGPMFEYVYMEHN